MSVVMLHSVGSDKTNWCQNWLSMSLIHFEEFCKYLSKKGYKTGFLDEWYYLENNPDKKTDKHVFLTFDDGYLDNWVNAYPILEKYNLKATIFVNPEFVDPSDQLRPKGYYSNGKFSNENLQTLGFLNWKEVEYLDKTPIIDIQSHSMSHNYYFYSANVIDIYEGEDKYHWLSWIKKPNRKPFWQIEDQKNYVEYGYPIFEYGRALGLRRYFPNEDFIHLSINLYSKNEYKNKADYIKRLNKEILKYPGTIEDDNSLFERYFYELKNSKDTLEKHLNKQVDYLCWPGGGYNSISLQIAEEVGYKASTIASRDNHSNFDNSLSYKRIRRFGLNSLVRKKNIQTFSTNKKNIIHKFLAAEGHPFYRAYYLIKHYQNRVLSLIIKY